jgi:hypothetical protein
MLRHEEECKMDRIKQIERRIAKIKQDLAALGDMRPGCRCVMPTVRRMPCMVARTRGLLAGLSYPAA